MVELVEVEDESFETKQTGFEDDEEYYTDTDSEISSDDEDVPSIDETLAERLSALKDIIPPTTRTAISNTVSTTTSYVSSALSFSGKALFVISTSVLMLGVPWALAFAEEQQVAEMEKEMRARELGSELLSQPQSTTEQLQAQLGGAKPAL